MPQQEERGGKYYSLVYGRPLVLQIDPIEKEPAFHMLLRAIIFCTGTASCNQRCRFCQSRSLAQRREGKVPLLRSHYTGHLVGRLRKRSQE